MKIVHICLNAYNDGWGYQENLLPKYQQKAGHDVCIIASGTHFPSYLKEEEINAILLRGREYLYDGIKTYRLKTSIHTTGLTVHNPRLLRTLYREQPVIIFHHDVTVPSLLKVVFYKLFHPHIKLVVDNHADEINQSKNKVWTFLYTTLFTRSLLKIISPFVTRYYGVTPARCDYLIKFLGVPKHKVALLPIGGDSDLVGSIKDDIKNLRIKHHLPIDQKIIISGGKMGNDKGTIDLIEGFRRLKREEKKLALVLFGNFSDPDTQELAEQMEDVYIFGWCDRIKTMELLSLSDLACWPLLHTTLIEDAVACAVPVAIFKSGNTTHSVKGNGVLLERGDSEELYYSFKEVLFSGKYELYKESAKQIQNEYSYDVLGEKVIIDCMY